MRFGKSKLSDKLMRRAMAGVPLGTAAIEPLEGRLLFSAPTFIIGTYMQPNFLLSNWASRGVNTAFNADLQGLSPTVGNYASWSEAAVSAGLSIIRPPAGGSVSSEAGQSYLSNVIGWLQPDEPDDSPTGSTTSPSALAANYSAWSTTDGSDSWRRPVYLNFDGGEVNGIKGNVTPSTYYPGATLDGDIIGNDMYPITGWDATGDSGANNGPWLDLSMSTSLARYTAGTGTSILRSYAPNTPEFAIIETGDQYLAGLNPTDERGPTPGEFDGELWDAIINGAQGIIYFSTIPGAPPSPSFGYGSSVAPPYNMDDDTPAAVVTQMTAQDARITTLASMLVTPVNPDPSIYSFYAPPSIAPSTYTLEGGWRQYGGNTYFMVENRSSVALGSASFSLGGVSSGSSVTVVGESRNLTAGAGGSLSDSFAAYQTHIYEITPTVTVPAAPTNLGVTTLSNTSLGLNWTDNASNATSYIVQRCTTLNGTYSTVATLASTATSYTDTGLGVSVDYYYQVTAANSDGSSTAASAEGQTSVPNAPWGLVVNGATSSSLNLGWYYVSVNNTNMVVGRSTTSGGPYTTVATLGPAVTSYVDNSLAASTTYYYQISAINQVGSGSTTGSGTTSAGIQTAPAAPTNLGLATVSNTSIALTWTDNANNATSYVVQRCTTQNGTYSTVATLGANANSYTDTGLGVSVVYYYQLYASNSVGNSSMIGGVSQTSVPNSPWGLTVNGATTSTLNLGWYYNSVNNTNMVVGRSTTSGGPYTTVATLGPTVTSYVDSGLAGGTTYYYQVSAINAVGSGSTTGSGTTSATLPAAPTNLILTTLSNTSISLAWTDNATNATAYVVQRCTTQNGTYSTITTLGANATSYTDTGLGISVVYYYQVYASNSVGSSTIISGISQTSVPNSPWGFVASGPTASTLNLAWSIDSVNNTNVLVKRSTTSGGPYTTVATLVPTATNYVDTGLSGGTTYYYQISAINAVGSGSTTGSGATLASIPAAPTYLNLATVSNTSISLSWTDNATNATSYVVQRCTTQNGTYSTVATLGSNANSYTDTGLGVSVVYYYQVYASNSSGNSSMITGVSATSVPNGPYGLTTTVNNSTSLQLTWVDNSYNETNFIVMQSTSPNSGFTIVATLSANTQTWDAAGLTSGTTYYYQVYAINAVGSSGTTNASGTP